MTEAHAWNEKLDLGHEAMDHDHHLQVALLAAFTNAIEQGRPGVARRLVEQLHAYSSSHFLSEELLMDTGAYPHLEQHAEEHGILIERIEEIRAASASGENDLALSMALDLRAALAAHVAGADRALAEHVAGLRREQRQAASAAGAQ
jgi:hemerythrin